jgi:hypothetical protein
VIEVSKTVLPPPVLYKYCPPERIDIISDFRIRFSPPTDFNDTFDTWLSPRTSEMKTTLEPARAKLDRARRRNQFGILCLTKDADNHLMWVNYAQNHKGFVIGFRTSSPFFRAGGTLRDVRYPPQRPDPPQEDACFYKSPCWTYEKEWRYVRTFDDSEDRLVNIVHEDLIAEIIFGHCMKDGDISQIVSIAEALTKTSSSAAVALFQSTPDHTRLEFVNEPKTVECCNHCNGRGYRMKTKGTDQ